MPLNSTHPQYDRNRFKWQKCRDCADGEDTVKAGNQTYLPMLEGQGDADYQAYKARASFYSAAGRTVKGLAGAVLRKEPLLEFPVPEFLLSCGPAGENIGHIISTLVAEELTTGRMGILVDSTASEENGGQGQPYLALYYPENIINWADALVNGRRKPVLVVLQEDAPERDNEDDPFAWNEETECYRVLELLDYDTDSPHLRISVWKKSDEDDDDEDSKGNQKDGEDEGDAFAGFELISQVEPAYPGGKPIDEIPFDIINPLQCGLDVESPPILDLVNVNLAHYRNSADLEHGLHFTALPTAWVSGFNPATTRLRIGSATAWVTQNPTAKAGFLEFTGAGLHSITDAMEDKKKQMAALGARMLEDQKASVEAAQTVLLRHAGEESVLTFIVHSISEGLTRALGRLAAWLGQAGQKISVELNTDFNPLGIDAPTLITLMGAVQSGSASWDTLFYNMKRGELIPDGRTAEEEKALIEAGHPMLPANEMPQAGGGGGGGGLSKGAMKGADTASMPE